MARKDYSDEFRRQAVDLYESTPGATVRGIADDLGVERGTLRHWLDQFGTGKKTAADGNLTTSPLKPQTSAPFGVGPGGRDARAADHATPGSGQRAGGGDHQAHDRAGDPPIGGQVFRRGDELVTRFQFLADHQDAFEVKRLCELVEVERSSYYPWFKGAPAREARAAADTVLAEKIRAIHDEDNTVGAPRATAELNDGAPEKRLNHKRVARVIREHGIRGYQKRRRVKTTIPEPSGQKVPDLLNRDFTAQAPNQRYVGDITYLPLVPRSARLAAGRAGGGLPVEGSGLPACVDQPVVGEQRARQRGNGCPPGRVSLGSAQQEAEARHEPQAPDQTEGRGRHGHPGPGGSGIAEESGGLAGRGFEGGFAG
jgi:hypothetical protein